jgi:hypothetical protein
MSKFKIVTEGLQDVVFLEILLNISSNDPNVELVAAGGWSSAESLARSFLVRTGSNVALVVDADTTDPNLIEDRKRFLSRSLGEISSPSAWKVVVIAPEIEVLLFEDRKVIEELVGHPISDTDYTSGLYEPRAVLRRIFKNKPLAEVYRSRLPKVDLDRIREIPSIRELQSFMKGVGARPTSRRKIA